MNSIPTIQKSAPKINFLFSFLLKKLTSDILENFHRPLLILDRDLIVLWANKSYYSLFQTTSPKTEGVPLCRLGDGEWDISRLTDRLNEISFNHTDINNWEVSRTFGKIGQRTMLLNARQINSSQSNIDRHILLAIEDITDHKQAEKNLQTLSFTDELTNLFNRRGFLALTADRLKLARRTKMGSCLFFADVDGLKKINDAQGHAGGDLALVNIAGILKETFRESDIIARFSGDEFAIFMSPAVKGGEAMVAMRLKKSLVCFNSQKDGLHKLSLSMGSCYINPGDQSTIEEMMVRADEKLYELKNNRKTLLSGEEAYSEDCSKDE